VDRRPYQTRHTFAAETVRAVAGDVVQAQYRMRHASNTSTTDLYQSIVERERGTPIDVGGVLLVEETDAPPAKLRVAG
jgi:integrase